MNTDIRQGKLIQPPDRIPRPEHPISRANISDNALKVLYRLKNAGYEAYLVGGSVRDLLLGREPKDFDVATDASPEQIHELFRNSRMIGRRFRLVHVRFGNEIIEVATFRAGHEEGDAHTAAARTADETGRILRDNHYGTVEEDAWRRDFTVNALYYDIRDFCIRDFVGGMADIKGGTLRVIGDPQTRFREDPVRMLRAVRFATKLGFRIHPDTEQPLFKLTNLLEGIPPARLYEEIVKLFMSGYGLQTFEQLRHYGLFSVLFPWTEAALAEEEQGFPQLFLARALANTDLRIEQGLPVTPAFLFAALLWEPVRRLAEESHSDVEALQQATVEIIRLQITRVALPRRFSLPMKDIFSLQPRFEIRTGKRAARLLSHPRFRAAYDFLLLRAEAGEVDPDLAAYWTGLQRANPAPQPAYKRRAGSGRRRRPRGRTRHGPTPE